MFYDLVLSLLVGTLTQSATTRFDWFVESHENSAERVYTLRDDGNLTAIRFSFDSREGSILSKSFVDEQRELISAPPGRHLWLAHPDFLRTLEENIENLLNESSILRKKFPYLIRGSNQEWKVFSILESFADYVSETKKPLTLDELIQETDQRIQSSHQKFVPFLNLSERNWLQSIIDGVDLIEPVYSEFSESTTRIDAFGRYPLIALKNHGEVMIRALETWAESGPRFPLEWFVQEKELPLEVRMAGLMLITHNHTSEDLFLRACLAQLGPKTMIRAALALNKIYGNERLFWQRKGAYRINPNLASYFPRSEIEFLSRHRWREVNTSPKLQILPKIMGFKSVTGKNADDWLPYTKLYHYYGAVIVALRMRLELKLSANLTVRATSLLGHAYKYATASASPKELELMSQFYATGAKHALQLENLISQGR